jgi:hypothetical protein
MGAGALANMLSAGRTLEGIEPLGPRLPLVFGLDARLRMAGGHGYWVRDDDIVYARLGKRGQRLGRAELHPELTMGALLAAGLVDANMVLAHLRRRQRMDTSVGGSFGEGALAAVFASDSACADGGGSSSDGGGSCD